MPALKRFGVPNFRELAKLRVSQSSLRAVADDIGMSFSGLRSFLDGTAPHEDTVQKLTAWYLRVRDAGPPSKRKSDRPERAEVDAAIARLERYIIAAPTERERAERVRDVSARLFTKLSDS